MFKFRSSSIVNDLELKEKAVKQKSAQSKSVQSLFVQYPNIVLPSSVTKFNISPTVRIDANVIRNWMKSHRKKRIQEKKRQPNTIVHGEEKRNINNNVGQDFISHENSETGAVSSKKEIIPPPVQPKTAVDEIVRSNQSSSNLNREKGKEELDSLASSSVEKEGKRKLNGSSCKPGAKKMKLTPEIRETDVNSLLEVKYVSESIHICDICNRILYNTKDLTKHRITHMRCTLCKENFTSMEETKDHTDNHCIIKRVMNNLPKIILKRCDQITEIRRRYSSAFGITSDEDPSMNQRPPEKKFVVETEVTISAPSPNASPEVVLISEDRDSKSGENSGNTKPSSGQSIDRSRISEEPMKSFLDSSVIIPTSIKELEEKNNSSDEPELKIIGENIIDLSFDIEEITLLENILKRTKKLIADSNKQTDSPDSTIIKPAFHRNKLFELGNTKQYLGFCKIPVNISCAKQYSIKYGFETSLWLRKESTWSVMKSTKEDSRGESAMNNEVQQNKRVDITGAKNDVPSSDTSVSSAVTSKPIPVIVQEITRSVTTPHTESSSTISTSSTIFTTTSNSVSTTSNTHSSNTQLSIQTSSNFTNITSLSTSSIYRNSSSCAPLQNGTCSNNIFMETALLFGSQKSHTNDLIPVNSNNNANSIAASSSTRLLIQENRIIINPTSQNLFTNALSNKTSFVYSPSIKTPSGISHNIRNNDKSFSGLMTGNNVQMNVSSKNVTSMTEKLSSMKKTNNSQMKNYSERILLTKDGGIKTILQPAAMKSADNATTAMNWILNKSKNQIRWDATINGLNKNPDKTATIISNNSFQPKRLLAQEDPLLQARLVFNENSNGSDIPVSACLTPAPNNNAMLKNNCSMVVPSPSHNSIPELTFFPRPSGIGSEKRNYDRSSASASIGLKEKETQSESTTSPSTMLNGNSKFVPLIRVKSISELK